MNVTEFRSQIKPTSTLLIEEKEFTVLEVIKFRFDDGTFYIKCFLSDDYVFADDLNENCFLLVKEITTSFEPTFPEELVFKNKPFKFLYTAHAVAEKIQGQEIFKKGAGETFWDYSSDDDSYLSLGIYDQTNKRLDFYGKIINPEAVNLK